MPVKLKITMTEQNLSRSESLDWRWRVVETKNQEFDGAFYFGVKTTGIFCRPSCASRTPKRQNVSFFQSVAEAEAAGFRACLRCEPKSEFAPNASAALIVRAFELLRSSNDAPTLEELSQNLNVNPAHLQKTFKAVLGISPKEIADLLKLENFKREVKGTDVTTALYESGFGSSRALYEKAGASLGMTPAIYKKGGRGTIIRFTTVDSPLGKLMVAATEKGICAVSFGETAGELESELEAEFPAAKIECDGDGSLGTFVEAILKHLEGDPLATVNLPLDVLATAFQMRVWAELRRIPYGEMRTYKQVAESVGKPGAVRAVARACATNPAALLTPCHRVVATGGKPGGYRWGIERKTKLLEQEKLAKR